MRKTIIMKRKYWCLARNAANKEIKLKYVQLAHKCKKECAVSANSELQQLINSKNTKAFYNLVHKKTRLQNQKFFLISLYKVSIEKINT